jgi:hypothetical protein
LIALAAIVPLFLMTGSILVPLTAIATNTPSLGATFGALVWMFQYGHLPSLLGRRRRLRARGRHRDHRWCQAEAGPDPAGAGPVAESGLQLDLRSPVRS